MDTQPSTENTTDPSHVHKYDSKAITVTCTTDGYTLYFCACGDSYRDNNIVATGHSFGEWTITKEPTTAETGSIERTCSKCTEKEARILGKLIEGHTHRYIHKVTQAATCSARGEETYSCTCGDAYTASIEKLPHQYTQKVTRPTCTTGGHTTYTCSACNTSYNDNKKDPLGHNWTAATCTAPKTCKTCNTTTGSANGHTYQDKKCRVCGSWEPGCVGGLGTGDVDSNAAYINPGKFAGKKLQIAGLNSDSYLDLDNMGQGNYNWMLRAAIDEWAFLNQVEVTYACSADSSAVLAAINRGARLDLSFGSNETPGYANQGLSMPFTQTQRDQLAKISSPQFVDMMMYKGKSHGVVYPWAGVHMFHYNTTVLERYGVKTPAEYFMEGNWTWNTMEQVLEGATKDFNANGRIDGNDTFGMGTNIAHLASGLKYIEDPQTGRLTGTMGTNPMYKRYLDILYKGKYQTLAIQNGTKYVQTTSTPRCLTEIRDCEWYNFSNLHRPALDNGDIVEAIIAPAFSKQDPTTVVNVTTRFMCMLSSCDEPEAAFSLLCYVLKCGIRYISDYSVGLYENTYEGIQGASEWSKTWKKNFVEICKDRRAEFAKIEDWDQARYEKIIEKIFNDENTILNASKTYTNEVDTVYKDNATLPSSSLIPLLVREQNAWIAKYNALYAN